MLKAGVIRGVIDLPRYLFRETSVATSVWVLGPPRDANRDVLLLNAALMTEGPRSHQLITPGARSRIIDIWRSWQEDQSIADVDGSVAVRASFDKIQREGYVLAFARYFNDLPVVPPRDLVPPVGAANRPTVEQLRERLNELESRSAAVNTRLSALLDGWEGRGE